MTKRRVEGELLAVRVMHEQRWAYERVMERLSYHDMRVLVSKSPADGGLGYDLSEAQLKGLVTGYRNRMRSIEDHSLDEHRERELADLDRLTRLGNAALAKAAAEGRVDTDAAKLVLSASDARRKLLGLDAPTQTKVDVTMHDAVTEELNAMLARAGRKPVTTPEG